MSDVPARIDPASLRSAQFQGSFRKYDSRAVDQYLSDLAEKVADLNRYVDGLEREVAAASRASALSEPAPVPAAPLETPVLRTMSDDEIATLVGDETAFVLGTARKAAEEIRSKAEESAARMIRESSAEAARVVEASQAEVESLRATAEGARDAAVAKAEIEAGQIIGRANDDAERRTSEARAMADDELVRAERIRSEVDAEAENLRSEAKEEGRAMVNEAKEVRTRILEDLQRRRDLGRSQIERLVVGRDRMLEAYAAVRANVEEMTDELEHILDDPFEHDPALEEGFVGIVTSTSPSSDVPDLTVHEDEPSDAAEDHAEAAEPDAERDAEADPVDEIGPEPDPDPEPDLEPEPESEPDQEPDNAQDSIADPEADDAPDVDDLFARLRADREASVDRAHAVLSAPDEAEPAPADDDEAAGSASESPPEIDAVGEQYLASGDGYEHRSTVLADANKSLPRVLKRLLADEQNEVLDAVRRTESTDLAEVLPTAGDHALRYATAATQVVAEVAAAAAGTVDPKVDAVDVDHLTAGLATALVEPLRRRIERAAADVDGDHEELDERLRTLYREWKIDHIGRLTSDALISAYSLGLMTAAPKGSKVRWLIDPATGPCPDCQDNALEGAIEVGAEFPTGDARPQAHPGCSCMLAVDS